MTDSNRPELRTIRDFTDTYSEFTFNQIRYLVYNAKTNGMENSGVLVHIGKRIFINVEKFYAWALSNPTNNFVDQADDSADLTVAVSAKVDD